MTTKDIIKFAKAVGQSKKIKRSGWVREGVTNPESVADHSFRVIVLCMALANHFKIDQTKLIKMAIIHDLGETKTGDLVVERGKNIDNTAKAKKEMLEDQAVVDLLRAFGKEHHLIYHEMIERKSKEAKFFWQIDKLEMAIQAKEYEQEQGLKAKEFYENARMHIEDPVLRECFNILLNE
jgi:putative hydrolase of HD superfamily